MVAVVPVTEVAASVTTAGAFPNLNEAIFDPLVVPPVLTYSVENQNVWSSEGSTDMRE